MRVKINYEEREFPPGSKFTEVVMIVRKAKEKEPMIKSLIEKTGSDHIIFLLNGRIIKPPEYDSIQLNEGDDIRWIHPFFGG